MTRQSRALLCLCFCLISIGCLLLTRYHTGLATVIFTISGLGAGIVPLIREKQETSSAGRWPVSAGYVVYLVSFIIITNWVTNIFRVHIATSPIGQMTDMLLVLREMCDRYIAHQPVYTPISDIYGIPIQVVYLPGFFLPFSIPVALHIDMRWISLLAFAVAIFSLVVVRRSAFTPGHILIVIAAAAFTYLLTGGAAFYFMHTQEAIVLLYVGVLAWALINEYWFAAGIAAASCLMSRYFIFIPLSAGLVWLYVYHRAAAYRAAAGVIIGVLVLLSVSRTWGDLPHFIQIPLLYKDLLTDDKSIGAFRHVYQGSVGFAWFCGPHTLHIVRGINLAIIVIVPLAYFAIAGRYLRAVPPGIVILCGLQIFLVCFLTTLPLPFGYVLYTSAFLSIFMIKASLEARKSK